MQKKLNQLGLFGKFWEPGKVKTRLGRSIGNENSSTVYHTLLVTLLQKLNSCGEERTIAFAPVEKEKEFSDLVSQSALNWCIEPQSTGGLGERMNNFFESKFSSQPGKVVLIGSDCLEIEADTIDRAFSLLNESEVVLGPTFDGGYYLVGMSAFRPELFRDIAWSTGSVFDQSIERLQSHDINYSLLEKKNDVDELEDLVRLQEQLVARLESNDSGSPDHQLDVELSKVIETALAQS